MQNPSILVVDDSSTIRKIISRELKTAGYEVLFANNGMEALVTLEWSETLPALITLDIDMPRMNGFEVCEAIHKAAQDGNKKKKQIAEIPIIFVSANDTPDNRKRGYDLGIIDFISKPFMPGKMLSTVNKILAEKEQFPDMSALIVEDSPVVRQIIRTILTRHGVTIHEAADGHEALQILSQPDFTVDIIITDYVMPGISGEELCRQLREKEAFQQIPIFFISSVETKDAIIRFFKVGASDYLPKPFIDEEFRARILTHLRNRKYVNELHQLNYQLSYQADHDALTGLLNRRAFTRELTNSFARCTAEEEDLSCILIDLDHFKDVNDQYGHDTGDRVLKEFSTILKTVASDRFIPARYGGEEFALLLPGTDIDYASRIAEQIREQAAQKYYTWENRKFRVTTSLGLASFQKHRPSNQDRLLSIADKALYHAKGRGRNCSVLYDDDIA